MNINQVASNFFNNVPASAANVDARPVSKANVPTNSSLPITVSQRGTVAESNAKSKELSEAEIQKTVEQLNQILNANNDVNFKIDKGSGRMVVQVVDRETNTVIRQIPSKEIIEISKALEGKTGVFLKEQA